MTETASLYGPAAEDIPLIGDRLRNLAAHHDALLSDALEHVFQTGGKKIRPALVLLSGRLGVYNLHRLVTLAASLEVVHTAALVHDDTIDQATSRRGLDTINAVWDGKVAILVGDFLFAQSAYLAAQLDSVAIMQLLSETVMSMSTAELRQYSSTRAHTVDENDYLQRIAGKTASLFGMCGAGAAIVSEQGDWAIQALREYGTNLGMAFQIADDVLDFTGHFVSTGKPHGNDLEQGTITLPAILFSDSLPPGSSLDSDLRNGRNPRSLIEAIRDSDAPDRALEKAAEYAGAARRALVGFPASDGLDCLLQLTHHVVDRDR
jgi:all-trans-nonaprenyl-diphosphate synthase